MHGVDNQQYLEYISFMCAPENEYNCENCPENHNYDSGGFGNILPCGQFHCWVTCACKERDEDD